MKVDLAIVVIAEASKFNQHIKNLLLLKIL